MRGKTYIDINLAEDWQYPARTVRVRIADVARYFKTEARSMSGCRSLAGITGDWRNIDYIAQDCLEYFKEVNVEEMRRAGKREGMTPKF